MLCGPWGLKRPGPETGLTYSQVPPGLASTRVRGQPAARRETISHVFHMFMACIGPTGTNFAPAMQVLQVDRYRPCRCKLEFDLSRAPHGAQPIETDARSTSPSSQQPIDKRGQRVRGHVITRCLQVCVSH